MSGTTSFNPSTSDILLDAFERCGVRANSLTSEHFASGRRSLNLVLSTWANRGINLWKVSLVSVLMTQGQAVYPVDPSVIDVLDVYLRQYQMGSPQNVAPAFTTASGSATVTIAGLASTPVAGNYIAIMVPVSVGGLILQGFYPVVSVPTSGSCTITAASSATGSVTAGGAVPSFTTLAGSASVSVAFAAHGLLVGQSFTVQVSTSVGGLILQGPYTVASVPNANTFTITAAQIAGSSATVGENGGETQIAEQATIQGLTQNADPVDILLYPISRNEYAAVPDKAQQGRPTSYWFDRTLSPTLSMWLTADGNGPYELRYYVFSRIQDAVPTMGTTGDMPMRFFEAYAAEVAAHLAVKWAPDRFQMLDMIAQRTWKEASDEDREKAPTHMAPDFSGYFR